MAKTRYVLESNRILKKWKILIYDAIIKSKLLYGMETVHVNQASTLQRYASPSKAEIIRRVIRRQHKIQMFVALSHTHGSE
jgi:hypothetical protein